MGPRRGRVPPGPTPERKDAGTGIDLDPFLWVCRLVRRLMLSAPSSAARIAEGRTDTRAGKHKLPMSRPTSAITRYVYSTTLAHTSKVTHGRPASIRPVPGCDDPDHGRKSAAWENTRSALCDPCLQRLQPEGSLRILAALLRFDSDRTIGELVFTRRRSLEDDDEGWGAGR